MLLPLKSLTGESLGGGVEVGTLKSSSSKARHDLRTGRLAEKRPGVVGGLIKGVT